MVRTRLDLCVWICLLDMKYLLIWIYLSTDTNEFNKESGRKCVKLFRGSTKFTKGSQSSNPTHINQVISFDIWVSKKWITPEQNLAVAAERRNFTNALFFSPTTKIHSPSKWKCVFPTWNDLGHRRGSRMWWIFQCRLFIHILPVIFVLVLLYLSPL